MPHTDSTRVHGFDRRLLAAVRSIVGRTARIVAFVAGAPDYERYVAHVRVHHPDTIPLSRAVFERQRLADRYDRPGARCC